MVHQATSTGFSIGEKHAYVQWVCGAAIEPPEDDAELDRVFAALTAETTERDVRATLERVIGFDLAEILP